jgi:hypothetical protein
MPRKLQNRNQIESSNSDSVNDPSLHVCNELCSLEGHHGYDQMKYDVFPADGKYHVCYVTVSKHSIIRIADESLTYTEFMRYYDMTFFTYV